MDVVPDTSKVRQEQKKEAVPPVERPFGPFAYHEMVELDIARLDEGGVGIGFVQNCSVRVPFTLRGEKVLARIYRSKGTDAWADLMEIKTSSPERIQPTCSLFTQCSGCQFQHWGYENQLCWKTEQIKTLFAPLTSLPVSPTKSSPRTLGYRSKITPHFNKPKEGKPPSIGFLHLGKKMEIVDVAQCPIATEEINRSLPEVRKGVLESLQNYKKGATLLLRDTAEGVLTNSNAVATEHVGDLKFQFPAGAFFQNNPFILKAFVEHIVQEAQATGARFAIDTYCGSGLFGLSASLYFERVTGIEVSADSLKWAKLNAEGNNIANVEFITGDAASIFEKIEYPSEETVVIIDPPRKGCGPAFLQQLTAFQPRGVVYVSCNPETQAIDLQSLLGYEITSIQPFDLFPQTKHIENVVALMRKAQRALSSESP